MTDCDKKDLDEESKAFQESHFFSIAKIVWVFRKLDERLVNTGVKKQQTREKKRGI